MTGKKKIRGKCAVDGCDKQAKLRIWCVAHYQRWLRHGDPLAGAPSMPWGEAQRYYREVVIPYQGDECLFWPFTRRDFTYARMWHEGRMQYVSRLICEEENGPPPSPLHQAAHNCGNGHLGCVARKHMRWATPKENNDDRIIHGTIAFSARRLREDDLRKIRASNDSTARIAQQLGLVPSTVRRARNRMKGKG
jgi:hypothetical protein